MVVWLFFLQIEMMSEAIDETLDKDEAEEETEELTNQVRYFIYWQFSLFHFSFIGIASIKFFFHTALTYIVDYQVLDEIGVDIASQVGFLKLILSKKFHDLLHFSNCKNV